MSDLIKRSDAIETAYQLRRKPNDEEWEEWLRSFNAIPSADRPQGSWKEDYNGGGFKEWLDITCSLCGETLHDIQRIPKDYKYCPFCGARMKGADDAL